MGNGVEQHFRKEELSFLKQVEEWVEEVRMQYAPVLTNYLDPRQQFIVEAIVGQFDDVRYYFDGGYIDAERKRCMICPEYYEPTSEDFENALFHIQYPKKFATLGHGKILGSLMSLGFDRSLIGDIISNGEDWQLFCAQNMKEYIKQQLEKIGKVAVRLEEVDYTKLIVPVDHWTAVQTVVSSLRLDTVIASVFNVSRQRSKEMIESGKVKVNWTEENRPDFMLEILDIVSIRGYGRLQIQKIEGRTKKDKIKISEYIKHVVRMHHMITKIHPFSDGNGRTTRAFMNVQLVRKGLSPLYIKVKEKKEYLDALEIADTKNNYDSLYEVIIKIMLRCNSEISQSA